MCFTLKVLVAESFLCKPVLEFLKVYTDVSDRSASGPSGYPREAKQSLLSENVSPKIKPMRSCSSRAIRRGLSGEEVRAALRTRMVVIDEMIIPVYIDV